ncbi:hypothetical protein [Jatrophihabitans sp.]|uniref:hypothetical protein n=1 Tax=Jatrophihabitans sp. TaxID=1932789 RepID=UPI002CCA86DE|nr:hypothetical protein [Jatrophihabitans sp.]
MEDAEWLVKWVSSDGTTLTALAQARIGRQATRFGGAIPVGVRSVSSDLRPDLLLACEVAGTVRMSVVDAKRRSSEVMNASAAAEAGSKYLWGLRTVSGDGTSAVVSLKGVVLATTATPPKLHDAAARIVGARLVPGENDDAFTKSIATALTQPEADD